AGGEGASAARTHRAGAPRTRRLLSERVPGSKASEEPGSSVLLDYLNDQLARQDARKVSLEQRALAVITTSGALVTLLFGLAALSSKRAATFTLPGSASVF